MSLRVVQWSTGNVGTFALRCILGHPELELAGLWVHGEAKAGRDAGELCGLAPTAAPTVHKSSLPPPSFMVCSAVPEQPPSFQFWPIEQQPPFTPPM